MSDKTVFDVNQYKEKQLKRILANGYQAYGQYNLEKIPSRDIPRHVLDFLYGQCIQSNCVAYQRHVEQSSTHVEGAGYHYHGWLMSVFVNIQNVIQVSAHNQGVELIIYPDNRKELDAFLEVLKSLQYEVRS